MAWTYGSNELECVIKQRASKENEGKQFPYRKHLRTQDWRQIKRQKTKQKQKKQQSV